MVLNLVPSITALALHHTLGILFIVVVAIINNLAPFAVDDCDFVLGWDLLDGKLVRMLVAAANIPWFIHDLVRSIAT